MFRLLVIFGVVLVIALTVLYIVVTVNAKHKETKKPPTMTNNEYDNYPQD